MVGHSFPFLAPEMGFEKKNCAIQCLSCLQGHCRQHMGQIWSNGCIMLHLQSDVHVDYLTLRRRTSVRGETRSRATQMPRAMLCGLTFYGFVCLHSTWSFTSLYRLGLLTIASYSLVHSIHNIAKIECRDPLGDLAC